MGPHLPDRRPTTPPGVRVVGAVRSPAGVVVAIVAGTLAGVAGLGIPGVVGVAAAGWVVSVLVGLLWRSPRPAAPDPFAVGEPWRRYVRAAVRHQRRFAEACGTAPQGPLRARLEGLGSRVDDAVAEVWEIAQAGHRLSRARRAIGATPPPSGDAASVPPPESTVRPPEPETEVDDAAFEAQSAHDDAAGRLEGTINSTEQRLAALDAQLGTVVNRAIEVSATAGTNAEFGLVEGDLTQLLDEMEALRLALGELGTTEAGGAPPRPDGDER